MILRLIIVITEILLMGVMTAFFFTIYVSMVRSIIAGAPFVPMSKRFVEPLLDMARITPGDTFLDIGCGDGRIMDAALNRGAGCAIGYEVASWPLYFARRRLKLWGERVTLIQQDARKGDLSSATVVYMYLLPKIVDTLAPYLGSQLKPGSQVLSASFPINLSKHTSFRLLEERNMGRITGYLYERVQVSHFAYVRPEGFGFASQPASGFRASHRLAVASSDATSLRRSNPSASIHDAKRDT